MHADKIIILENGKISEEGTHKQLMLNHNGYYYKTCVLQNGAIEDGGDN
jgi:ABC-type multidrug transport system fused ATPase/permease subunit